MPNWCYTNITFYSMKEEVLNDFFYSVLQPMKSETAFPDAWCGYSGWLGNFLLMAGFDKTAIENDELPFRYRGSVQDIQDISYLESKKLFHFTIFTETAWGPMIEMWYEILRKMNLIDDIAIAYSSEEPGCELYWKWDTSKCFYPERYYVDAYLEWNDMEKILNAFPHLKKDYDIYRGDFTQEKAIELMQEITGSNSTNKYELQEAMDDFNERLGEISDDSYIHVHEYQEYTTEK